jgi:hypothetical protein
MSANDPCGAARRPKPETAERVGRFPGRSAPGGDPKPGHCQVPAWGAVAPARRTDPETERPRRGFPGCGAGVES